MTKEEIEEALHRMDLLQRPFVFFVNPSEEEKIVQALKDINEEDKVLVKTTEFVELGKAIVVKREELERWTFGHGYNNNAPYF